MTPNLQELKEITNGSRKETAHLGNKKSKSGIYACGKINRNPCGKKADQQYPH